MTREEYVRKMTAINKEFKEINDGFYTYSKILRIQELIEETDKLNDEYYWHKNP